MTPESASSKSWNMVKGGSTVPLKFRVWNEGVEQTDIAVVRSITRTTTSCTAGNADIVPDEATGGTSLRYTDGQFIFNWSVPKGAGKCYHVILTAADGTQLLGAYFKTR